jgi:hypothetical protein
MRRKGLSKGLAVAVLLCGATLSLAQATKPAPSTPIDAKKAELGGKTWNPAWDRIVEQAIPRSMLSRRVPHDVRTFCPSFYEMSNTNKRVFWAYFFQALAGAEAGLNPTTNVQHTQPAVDKVDGVSHHVIHSEGLLQLTYEDARRYGCSFNWAWDRWLPGHDPAKTILRPRNNLECGVKILDNQIIAQHKPLLSRTSYWSTLQPGTQGYQVFVKEMTNPPAACGKQERPPALKQATTVSVQEKAKRMRAAR